MVKVKIGLKFIIRADTCLHMLQVKSSCLKLCRSNDMMFESLRIIYWVFVRRQLGALWVRMKQEWQAWILVQAGEWIHGNSFDFSFNFYIRLTISLVVMRRTYLYRTEPWGRFNWLFARLLGRFWNIFESEVSQLFMDMSMLRLQTKTVSPPGSQVLNSL